MDQSLYGGIAYPTSPFVFDAVYPNYNEALAMAETDKILIGRYILVAYCNEIFEKDQRITYETDVNNGWTSIKIDETTSDEDKYKQNYYIDKINNKLFEYEPKKFYSNDRRVYRKTYDGETYSYTPVITLHSNLSTKALPILGIEDNDKILKISNDSEKILSSTLSLTYDGKGGRIYLRGIGEEEISSIDTQDFVADGMLDDVAYDDNTNELIFTWKIYNSETNSYDKNKVTKINLYNIIDPYGSGPGITVSSMPNENPKISIKIDATSEEGFLTVSADGLKVTGIRAEIDSKIKEALSWGSFEEE